MREIPFYVNTDRPRDVILVLDASASSQQRKATVELLNSFFVDLPHTIQPKLYFLGNMNEYPSSGFSRNGNKWYGENVRRTRLLRPIYEALSNRTARVILVFAAGPIFDVEDWLDTPQFGWTTFIRCRDSANAKPGASDTWMTEELLQRECEPTLEELRRLVHDPIERVEVWCPHGMPYFWDNDAYCFEDNRLIAAAAPNGSTKGRVFSVWVGFLSELATQPRAVTTLKSGERLEMANDDIPPPAERMWETLPTEEAVRFRQCQEQHNWLCPKCNEIHERDFVFCKKDWENHSTMPALAYPSLERARRRGFVLFRDIGSAVEVCHHACDALRLDVNRIVVRQAYKTSIHHSAGSDRQWQPTTESLKQYTPLCENGSVTAYVVFL